MGRFRPKTVTFISAVRFSVVTPMQKRRGAMATAAVSRIAMPLFSLAQYPPLNKWLAATVLVRSLSRATDDR